MCFSAEASFGASAVLGAIGVISLRKCSNRKHRLFAAIPIFFAFQQLSEGFVWLSFSSPGWEIYRSTFAYIFLVFALLVWPVWMPVSVWLLEPRENVKKLLAGFSVLGVLFAVLAGFFLFSHTVFPAIKDHHIHYALGFTGHLFKGASLLYFIPTVIPTLFSSRRSVNFFGFYLALSFLISEHYFGQAVVSVWCFLAAGMSIIVLWAVLEMKKTDNTLA
ncbi:hypothetical protein I5M27_02085 [Adhaeribacter sp. BT258]|uniref:Uncharacterized protein n=1 Tax=Adhaeribacter terrigena TaxID=2793070 RepID=A0ABS1BX73_9BACT|nr:DUF6629 family protein [Adhaeribacter terrigena]MBK0401755.1 hypothetical protein [Adhaeribacter terrigena]